MNLQKEVSEEENNYYTIFVTLQTGYRYQLQVTANMPAYYLYLSMTNATGWANGTYGLFHNNNLVKYSNFSVSQYYIGPNSDIKLIVGKYQPEQEVPKAQLIESDMPQYSYNITVTLQTGYTYLIPNITANMPVYYLYLSMTQATGWRNGTYGLFFNNNLIKYCNYSVSQYYIGPNSNIKLIMGTYKVEQSNATKFNLTVLDESNYQIRAYPVNSTTQVNHLYNQIKNATNYSDFGLFYNRTIALPKNSTAPISQYKLNNATVVNLRMTNTAAPVEATQ